MGEYGFPYGLAEPAFWPCLPMKTPATPDAPCRPARIERMGIDTSTSQGLQHAAARHERAAVMTPTAGTAIQNETPYRLPRIATAYAPMP